MRLCLLLLSKVTLWVYDILQQKFREAVGEWEKERGWHVQDTRLEKFEYKIDMEFYKRWVSGGPPSQTLWSRPVHCSLQISLWTVSVVKYYKVSYGSRAATYTHVSYSQQAWASEASCDSMARIPQFWSTKIALNFNQSTIHWCEIYWPDRIHIFRW